MIIFVAVSYVSQISLKDSQMSEKRKRLGSLAIVPDLYTQSILDFNLKATLNAARTMGSRLQFPVFPLMHFFANYDGHFSSETSCMRKQNIFRH